MMNYYPDKSQERCTISNMQSETMLSLLAGSEIQQHFACIWCHFLRRKPISTSGPHCHHVSGLHLPCRSFAHNTVIVCNLNSMLGRQWTSWAWTWPSYLSYLTYVRTCSQQSSSISTSERAHTFAQVALFFGDVWSRNFMCLTKQCN